MTYKSLYSWIDKCPEIGGSLCFRILLHYYRVQGSFYIQFPVTWNHQPCQHGNVLTDLHTSGHPISLYYSLESQQI